MWNAPNSAWYIVSDQKVLAIVISLYTEETKTCLRKRKYPLCIIFLGLS